ncbi:MAG: hypothetical protein L3J42_07255 [Hydrogenimonas sp.]|nr:hypothetical protein [Hydrogenimonas sp.]
MEAVKTVVLLTLMTLLMVWVGGIFGGQSGMLIALAIAGVMNFFSYFYSDKLVLRHYHAVEVDELRLWSAKQLAGGMLWSIAAPKQALSGICDRIRPC